MFNQHHWIDVNSLVYVNKVTHVGYVNYVQVNYIDNKLKLISYTTIHNYAEGLLLRT